MSPIPIEINCLHIPFRTANAKQGTLPSKQSSRILDSRRLDFLSRCIIDDTPNKREDSSLGTSRDP